MLFALRFFKLFHYPLQSVLGNKSLNWEEVANDLENLLNEEKSAPVPLGFKNEDLLEARFPVLVWIDECLLSLGSAQNGSQNQSEKKSWYDFSLQRKYLNTNQGGELFYQRLAELLARRKAPAQTKPAPVAVAAKDSFEPPSPYDFYESFSEENLNGDSFLSKGEEMDLKIISLWEKPGKGSDPLESILDVFALAIVLGFQGRASLERSGFFSSADPTRDATQPPPPVVPELSAKGKKGEKASKKAKKADQKFKSETSVFEVPPREQILELSRKQLSRWEIKGFWSKKRDVKLSLWGRIKHFWEDYDWFFYHILIPVAMIIVLYWRGAEIVQSLIFN
ncbi:MAG: DotU family type IV/VI secretion system protein [Deltaproteobacteria bacterium]|jgi:hypothetical protein|nr:DotU family type IV/VI secretion system protein [Deltaproteobacteria bacterium]